MLSCSEIGPVYLEDVPICGRQSQFGLYPLQRQPPPHTTGVLSSSSFIQQVEVGACGILQFLLENQLYLIDTDLKDIEGITERCAECGWGIER